MNQIIVALLLGRALADRCDLEEDGWCNFADNICVFSDVSRKNTDQSSPLETLLDANVRSKNTNNKCPVPQVGDPPFQILIEPCYSNGTATPRNLKSCPDIPSEYYTQTVAPILSNDGKITDSPGAVVGIPTEFNVIHIGKNLVLGNQDNTKHKMANTNIQGTLMSKFKWRTLPVDSDTFTNIMEEGQSSTEIFAAQFSSLANTTFAFARDVNTWEPTRAPGDSDYDYMAKQILSCGGAPDNRAPFFNGIDVRSAGSGYAKWSESGTMGAAPIKNICYGFTELTYYLSGCSWTTKNDGFPKSLNILSKPASMLSMLQSIPTKREDFPQTPFYNIGRGGGGETFLPRTPIPGRVKPNFPYMYSLADAFSALLPKTNFVNLLTNSDNVDFWNSVPNFAKQLSYGVPTVALSCAETGYTESDVASASFAYWFAYMFRRIYVDVNKQVDSDFFNDGKAWPPKFDAFDPSKNFALKQWEATFGISFDDTINFLFSPDYTDTFRVYESLVAQAFMAASSEVPMASNDEVIGYAFQCFSNKKGTNLFLWDVLDCKCFPMIIKPTQCVTKGLPDPPSLQRLQVDVGARFATDASVITAPDITIITLPQLTCPLEVRFADDRTPSMSATQQLENVYVESSNLFADQPQNYLGIGRGCYMCFADEFGNLSKTLSANLTWLGHYSSSRCNGGYIVPSLDVQPPEEYKGPAGSSKPVDIASLFKLGDVNSLITTEMPIGVYKLYPFLDVQPVPPAFADQKKTDAFATDKDGGGEDVFVKWEKKAAEQIGYYLDPNWHVTIEVVGMEKQKGKQIVRNFHGRILEESLAVLEANRFTYNDVPVDINIDENEAGSVIDWSYWLGEKKNPYYPNNCLFTKVNMDILETDEGGCFNGEVPLPGSNPEVCEELACKTDFPGDVIYNVLTGNLSVNLALDLNEITILMGGDYSKAASMAATPGITTIFMLPPEFDGVSFTTKEEGQFNPPTDIKLVQQAPLARRKDGVCIDKPGSAKVQMPFSAQCLLSELTETKLVSTTISLCDPDKAVRGYDGGDAAIEAWVRETFNPESPTGISRELYNIFDSVEFKVAVSLASIFNPILARFGNAEDIVFCMSPFGPTSTAEIFEFLALGCTACTPSNDPDTVFEGGFGECFSLVSGSPCRGYMGPAPVGGDLRNDVDWSMFEVLSEPVPCMFEQVIHFYRRFNPDLCDHGYCTNIIPPQGSDAEKAKKQQGLTFAMCDTSFIRNMDTFKYGGPTLVSVNEEGVTSENLGGIVLNRYTWASSVEAIIDEINILGVSVTTPLFSKATPFQFPNGVIVTSTHPLIHTRIQRILGSGLVTTRGCNVILLGTPNVTFERVEFDNAACQEQGLNQLTYKPSNSPEIPEDRDTLKLGFFDLKAWNMAPIHITTVNRAYSPTDVVFRDIKLTAALNFRKMYPGRPLMSIDNNGNGGGPFVNVEGLVLDGFNDTHKYRDDRDSIVDPVPLMPLQVIMWHVAGNMTLGTFTEETDMVVFSDRGSFNLLYNDQITKAKAPCPDVSSPPNATYLSLSQYTRDCTANKKCYVSLPDSAKENSKWKKKAFCFLNSSYPELNNLVVLDGSDFFDIAYDRYRCFDKPKLNCASEPVLPFFYVTFSLVGAYMIFFTFIRSTGLFQPDECLDILQTVDDALAEATRPGNDPIDEGDAFKEDVKFLEPKLEQAEERGQIILKRVVGGTLYNKFI